MASAPPRTGSSSSNNPGGQLPPKPSSDLEAARQQQKGDTTAAAAFAPPNQASFARVILHPDGVSAAVVDAQYPGAGTHDNPFVVDFLPEDSHNPMKFSNTYKWYILGLQAISTLAITFASSAYSAGLLEVEADFGVSTEVAILGLSLFVLGFAVGPLLWAPLSEMYGRQVPLLVSTVCLTAFSAGTAGATNIETLLVLRTFGGIFGSSLMTNAAGIIADIFTTNQRGLAVAIFASAPFLGPSVGPIVGGFVSQSVGWRWIQGVIAIFTGILCILGSFTMPETYAPYLLRRRAGRLSKLTGKDYVSKLDVGKPPKSISQEYKLALSRPWILLFCEPIVLVTSIYIAIIYGTLYMLFAAFPIVFQQHRGWSTGIGGLAFVGVAIGMMAAIAYAIYDNGRYMRVVQRKNGAAAPEDRLPPALIGSLLLPIGLFWFAWTDGPEIHWVVSIIASAFFAAGVVLAFLSLLNYLIDSYVVFAASAFAANTVLRSLFGVAFPLFTPYMYENLGIHWATCVPAFLALACVPLPFLFYKYGAAIRKRCKFAAEAAEILARLRSQNVQIDEDDAMEVVMSRIRSGSAPTSGSTAAARAEAMARAEKEEREADDTAGEGISDKEVR